MLIHTITMEYINIEVMVMEKSMKYVDRIENLISNISTTVVDFSSERTHGTPPTQVSSEFLTNKEQGDWAEKTLMDGINNHSKEYIAVKYGRDDDIIAGEDGFKEFYNDYQKELDEVGKRPDLLIFRKTDFPYENIYNISHLPLSELDIIVPKALCGIEVRSSAFLIDKYEEFMREKQERLSIEIMLIKQEILSNYSELLKRKDKQLYDIICLLNEENLHVISFRCPTWRSNDELAKLSKLLKIIKNNLSEITKRTFLSITPKVEDLKVVYNWIKRYNVPHFYVQVFFDKAYGISFEKILTFLTEPDLEGKKYFIESDVKNQNKTTIKIHANEEANILNKVYLPEHYSVMKELGRGRLLFYVKFKNSMAVINDTEFKKLFDIKL